jgi:hypothetical protein
VTTQTWISFQKAQEKWQIAEMARQERHERDLRRAQNRADQLAYGRFLSEQRARQVQSNRDSKKKKTAENQEDSAQVRLEEAVWKRRQDQLDAQYMDKVRERVQYGRNLDAKLDALEEAQDRMERTEGSEMKQLIANALREVRDGGLAFRRSNAAALREATRQGLHDSLEDLREENSQRVQAKRSQSKALNIRKQEFEDEYLRNARAQKEAAEARRKGIRMSARAMQRRKKENADQIRADVNLDFDTSIRGIQVSKAHVREAYSKKFVSSEHAEQWFGSPLQRLHAAAKFAMDSFSNALPIPSSDSKGIDSTDGATVKI